MSNLCQNKLLRGNVMEKSKSNIKFKKREQNRKKNPELIIAIIKISRSALRL